MRFLLPVLVAGACILACGGKLATSATDGTSSGGGGGGSCTSGVVQAANRACVPGTAQANHLLAIDIDSTQACLPCGATIEPCSVSVSGSTITVGLVTQVCPVDQRVCPELCAVPAVSCGLPALAAGTYTVKVVGEGENALPRQLVVSDTAEDTSCELVRPAPSVGPFDFGSYGKACTTADDCTVVPSLLCRPCACEDTPIAKSALNRYETDFRAATSQCAAQPGGACAPCAPRVASCVRGQCSTAT